MSTKPPDREELPLVAVSGATGFIGRRVCAALAKAWRVRCLVRSSVDTVPHPEYESVIVGDLVRISDWTAALKGASAVVHLAARAHRRREKGPRFQRIYYDENVRVSQRLARAAADQGVRQFLFLSTVGVHGSSSGAEPLDEGSPIRPETPYALSKWEAETRLRELAATSEMRLTVFRPTLVYGPEAPGNFGRLVQAVRRGLPLPLQNVRNHRSLCYRENLASGVAAALAPRGNAPRSEAFLLADAEAISTPDLIRLISEALQTEPRLFSLPSGVLRLGAAVLGLREELAQISGSLVVSTDLIHRELGWEQPFQLREAVQRTLNGPPLRVPPAGPSAASN